jgi:hypothetical protein
MMTIREEIDAYEGMRSELEADSLGRWALIRDRQLIDVFDNFDQAAAQAVRAFGRGPYLNRQIGAPPAILPAAVLIRA